MPLIDPSIDSSDDDPLFSEFLSNPLGYRSASFSPDHTSEVGSWRSRIRQAGHQIKKGAKLATRFEPVHATTQSLKYAGRYGGRLAAAATGPIRRRIFKAIFGTLTKRRAQLLAYQSRGTLVPTARDHAEARQWTVSYLRRKGPIGRIVAATLSGTHVGEPATASLVAVSVPVLLQFARALLRSAQREGAPADPRTAASQQSDASPSESPRQAQRAEGDET